MDILKFIEHLPAEVVEHIKQTDAALVNALAKLKLAYKIVAEVKAELPKAKAVVQAAMNELPAFEQIASDIKAFEA